MPLTRSSSKPPKVMTWPKASKTLMVAGISDALRYFFLMFWFFAPAIAVVYCSAKVDGVLQNWTAGMLGAKTAAVACTTAVGGTIVGLTAITGGLSAEAVEAFGTIMAMAVGFLGWLTVTLMVVLTDMRTFKENPSSALWVFAGLTASVFLMAWRVYAAQIKREKAAYKKWEKENAAVLQEQRNEQVARATLLEQEQQTQSAQEQAANNEQYAQEQKRAEQEAANDDAYGSQQSPDELDKAA
jgi:hypothetical protein